MRTCPAAIHAGSLLVGSRVERIYYVDDSHLWRRAVISRWIVFVKRFMAR